MSSSRLLTLFPHLRAFHLDAVRVATDGITLDLRPTRRSARCPLCGARATRVQSTYLRTMRDLPCGGLPLILRVRVRRFHCASSICPRRIFAEQFPDLAAPRARQTARLRVGLQQIGLVLGGKAGARLSGKLAMPISGKGLLHLVRRAPLPPVDPPRVIGIDDWAWRRGHRYGTILCDLERHRPVALLPDRAAETVAAWLQGQPQIEVVARDRGGLYADGASRGAPMALQVADRWHLVDNLVDALERFLLHKRTLLKQMAAHIAASSDGGDPSGSGACMPTDEMYVGRRRHPPPRRWHQRAEEESHRRHAARLACYERIYALAAAGADKADIARMVGVSRQTVHRYLAMSAPPERRQPRRRGTVLDAWVPYLLRRWGEGCHNGMRLWREIQEQGFAYSCSNVARFVARIRRGEIVCPQACPDDASGAGGSGTPAPVGRPLAQEWSARRVASLMVYRRERLSERQAAYLMPVCAADAAIGEAYRLTQEFLGMVRERRGDQLADWIAAAQGSDLAEVRRYAIGLRADLAAVEAGLTLEWSNGQVEGQIHRLKLLKRQMYGRAGFDLLRTRVLATA
jgi:transposase